MKLLVEGRASADLMGKRRSSRDSFVESTMPSRVRAVTTIPDIAPQTEIILRRAVSNVTGGKNCFGANKTGS